MGKEEELLTRQRISSTADDIQWSRPVLNSISQVRLHLINSSARREIYSEYEDETECTVQ